MRTSLFLLSFLSFALGLQAGQQTFTATPQSIAGWTLVGAELSAVLGQTEFILPANAQLVRSFSATDVSLQLATRPMLGETAGDWTMIEIGTAALILSRHGAEGRLQLALGDLAPQELPFTFALDSAGRSVDVLAIGFARDSRGVRVTLAGQTLPVPVALGAGGIWEVVVSAGANQGWTFQQLAITAVVSSPSVLARTDSSGEPVLTAASLLLGDKLADGKIFLPSLGSAVPAGAPLLKSFNKAGADSGGNTLEIYTPPSVRHGKPQVIRGAAQGQSQN